MVGVHACTHTCMCARAFSQRSKSRISVSFLTPCILIHPSDMLLNPASSAVTTHPGWATSPPPCCSLSASSGSGQSRLTGYLGSAVPPPPTLHTEARATINVKALSHVTSLLRALGGSYLTQTRSQTPACKTQTNRPHHLSDSSAVIS